MAWFFQIVTNKFLITALSSWFVAQLLKTVINAIITRKFDILRLFGDGGMPSGHSATVTSLATGIGLSFGFNSYQFAITTVLAIIVCHDATGVRLETGKQAVVINELVKLFKTPNSSEFPEVKLKEFVGHTPFQVLAGILVGIINTLFIYFAFGF